MHAAKFLVAFALGLTATLAHAAGFRFIEVPADTNDAVLNGAMWYPCSEPLSVARDCPISGDKLPLIVVSHSQGSSFLSLYDVAEMLADAGFVVAAVNHPGDTGSDRSRSDNLSAFVERAADIRRLAGHMLGASAAASKIDPKRIGFFGFSRGGYTGLVLIAANPDWAKASEFCQQSSLHVCEQIRRKEFPAQPLAYDPRIRAAVVADPSGGLFFTVESLSTVKTPVQLWASELGGDGVTQESRGRREQKSAGKARVSFGAELRALRLHDLPAGTGEGYRGDMHERAGLSTASPSTSSSMLVYSPSFEPSSGRHTTNSADLAKNGVSCGFADSLEGRIDRRWPGALSRRKCIPPLVCEGDPEPVKRSPVSF